MSGRREVPPRTKRGFSKKSLVAVSLALVFIVVVGSLVSYTLLHTRGRFSMKAAIVDQLGEHFPNETFQETVTSMLTDAGFNVTYHPSEAVTVAFYKELAKQDYGIIVLRSHSALREDQSVVDLFTSEEYNSSRYSQEQKDGLLTRGSYLFETESNRSYFAVTARFIESLAGRFPRTIVVAMGCWSLRIGHAELAKAFASKGAEAYFGWSSIVLPDDTDRETVNLLEEVVLQNASLGVAADGAKTYTYPTDQGVVQSRISLNPASAANLKLSQLIADATSSQKAMWASVFVTGVYLKKPSLWMEPESASSC